jgi:pimeloyl-ACP methyl ester carboxylesterase
MSHRERVAQFGPQRALVGVVAEPVAASAAPGGGARRAVLMANIGMHHRVGPFRVYVDLSRALADAGTLALRFDLSGLGDSAPRAGVSSDLEGAILDMVDAMDWLQGRYDVEEFVIVGLCSGVDAAHATALRDPRVKGVVFIDGYTYPTAGFSRRGSTVRFLQLERWSRYLRRRAAMRAAARTAATVAPSTPAPAAEAPTFSREYPAIEQFRRDIAQLAGRATRMLFVFTGTVDSRYNSRGQLWEMLGAQVPRERIELEWYRRADHVFSACAHRETLVRRIVRFAAPGA